MRGLCVLVAVALRRARALGVEEQIRIDHPTENPLEPDPAFAKNLSAGRRTLIFANDLFLQSPLVQKYLRPKSHHLTQWTPDVKLQHNGFYQFDSIIIADPQYLQNPKVARGITSLYDVRWILTLAYDDRYRAEMGGLNLPPSILVLTDPGDTLDHFGIKSAKTEPEDAECGEPDVDAFGLLRRSLGEGQGPHEVQQLRTLSVKPSEFLSVVASTKCMEEHTAHTRPVAVAVQGDMSWSRLLVFAPGKGPHVCVDDFGPHCTRALDWVFHRSHMQTWSHLQHFAMNDSGREFDKFTGAVNQDYIKINNSQNPSEISTWLRTHVRLEQNKPLYTILDELLVTIDIYHLVEDAPNEYSWAPSKGTRRGQLEQLRQDQQFVATYQMLVPYMRKPMAAYGTLSETSTTHFMDLAQRSSFMVKFRLIRGATKWLHFVAPNKHGIFKFVVQPMIENIDHKLRSALWVETLMPTRPYTHDKEEPRFLTAAWPLYVGIAAIIIGNAVTLMSKMEKLKE